MPYFLLPRSRFKLAAVLWAAAFAVSSAHNAAAAEDEARLRPAAYQFGKMLAFFGTGIAMYDLGHTKPEDFVKIFGSVAHSANLFEAPTGLLERIAEAKRKLKEGPGSKEAMAKEIVSIASDLDGFFDAVYEEEVPFKLAGLTLGGAVEMLIIHAEDPEGDGRIRSMITRGQPDFEHAYSLLLQADGVPQAVLGPARSILFHLDEARRGKTKLDPALLKRKMLRIEAAHERAMAAPSQARAQSSEGRRASQAFHQARIALYEGNQERALEILDYIIMRDKGNAQAYYEKGCLLKKLKRYKEAEEYYSKAIENASDQWRYRQARAELRQSSMLRDDEGAIKDLKHALILRPRNPWLLLILGSALANQGNYEEAVRSYTKALEIFPLFSVALDRRARAYSYWKKDKQAARDYEALLGMPLEEAKLIKYRVQMHGLRKEYAQQLEGLKKLAELEPDNADPMESIAEVYMKQKNYPEAARAHEKALKINPRSYYSAMNLPICLCSAGDLDGAFAAGERTVKDFPDESAAAINQGQRLMQKGMPEEAEKQFLRAAGMAKTVSEKSSAKFNLGWLYWSQGSLEKAKPYFREAAAPGAESGLAYSARGYLALMSDALPDTKAHAEKAIGSDPEESDGHFLLGLVLEREGRLGNALEHYEKAAEFAGCWTEAYVRAGLIAQKLGKKDKARRHLDKARSFNPSHPLSAVFASGEPSDGRLPLEDLYGAAGRLAFRDGWTSEVVFTDEGLPMKVIRTAREGPALWLLAGMHGEEPAPPNAVARNIDTVAALASKGIPVVLFPLCNPVGYSKGWRYPDARRASKETPGHSVGDSDHLLAGKDGKPRAPRATSPQADAFTKKVLELAERYPPILSVDLHEDEELDKGYVYSQGPKGFKDPAALAIVRKMKALKYPVLLLGKTRFDEPILNGVISGVNDGSIDELIASEKVLVDGKQRPGPGGRSVIVVETSARSKRLAERLKVHAAVIGMLERLYRAASR